MATYEPIMNALFNLLNNALVPGTFRYASRRYVSWEDLINSIQLNLQPFPQPALIVYDGVGFGGGKVRYEQRGRGRPPVRIISRTLIIYARLPGGGTPSGTDNTTTSGSIFHPLLEAIEAVFANVDSEGALTLGGLVSHAWIEGDNHFVPGDVDPSGQGLMTVPVQIMIP